MQKVIRDIRTYKFTEYQANDIIAGITELDSNILDLVYSDYYPDVERYILQNSGTVEDANEVYQAGILVIYRKAISQDLRLTCSFKTFLFSVCRLIWLKQLQNRKRWEAFVEDYGNFINLDDSVIRTYEYNERIKLYQKHFEKQSFNCRKILELFLATVPVAEIAGIFGFKSVAYSRKRKQQCKDKLVAGIKSDPTFGELAKTI
ncbi:MAG: hypothetical protein Kow00127_01220 [Bacteroidales bacterium]